MLSQVTTKSFNVYLKDNCIVSAKCRTTGRFVKRVIAQVELKAELKARTETHANVNKAINSSLVEKAKVQLQASIAKVAMLGMITLSAFNFS